jgi:glycosyltransferase involved in cell wall biosynthesis
MTVQGRLASIVALSEIRSGDVVYMWPPYDMPMVRRARDRGAIVVAERTNCMGEMCRDVLTLAYARRGRALPSDWFTPEFNSNEREHILACDYVTAPNDFVFQSLRQAEIPQSRILETSYGFNPTRLRAALTVDRTARAPVFAFVGLGIVRKGLDVLLEAWEQAGVDGTLLIAGLVADEMRTDYAAILERSNVRELGFVSDVASVYGAADVFVFPTHEEGGPLVIYEAAACGLASIVSPMGAGRIVRDGIEGLIINPLDVADVAAALTKLAENPELRQDFGRNAVQRASEFTWSKAGMQLHEQFRTIANRRC